MESLWRQGNDRGDNVHLLEKDGLKNAALSMVEEMDTSDRQTSMQNIHQKIQMQSNLVEEVGGKAMKMNGKVVEEIEQFDVAEIGSLYENVKKPNKDGGPPEKVFMARNSLLTVLFEVKHIRTIYNIFIIIVIFLFIDTAINDLVVVGKLNLGLDLLLWSFQGLGAFFCLWLILFATTLLLFFCFSFWVNQRIKWVPNTVARRCWDYGWLCAFIIYEILFLCLPAMKIMENVIAPASTMVFLMEQIRLIMKTYAFVRTNTPRALAYKPHQSGDKREISPCPDFSKYLYFLFAPTLLYRDNYPRTKEVHWKFVIWCFMEVIGSVYCITLFCERLVFPMYHNFGLAEHQAVPISQTLIVGMLGTMLPCTVILMLFFYCIQHSWMNAFAEMLRFADRMFYKDWWNASTIGMFCRTWNIIVHDWLYAFIYKDLNIILPSEKLWMARLRVFIISAVFHDYVLAFSFGYLYPIMGFEIIAGGIILFSMPNSNLLLWIILYMSFVLFGSGYGFEWYARVNCPQVLDPFWDFFVPRSWTCGNN